uniref:Cadherin domain-containing protein n=1 Tax=Rhabditophanes sp. KR3021 TaxID=114890 RepID=A0AC35TVE2_9BILA
MRKISTWMLAKNAKSILKARILNLITTGNLVKLKEISNNGLDTYYINYCITGASGQESTKFNIQLQLMDTNDLSLAPSIIAFCIYNVFCYLCKLESRPNKNRKRLAQYQNRFTEYRTINGTDDD